MKYYNIKRDVVNGTLERPLHLFLRMKQFIRDNLLLSSGKIEHDGKVPTTNETLSPTTERLNVLRWLYVLHPNLPMHVSNVYSQELQTKSLKDLQPRICEQVDDLLRQVEEKLETNEGVSASYSRFNRSGQYQRPQVPKQHSFQKSFQKPRSNTLPGDFPQNRKVRFKACDICKSLNLPFVGHDTHLCPNVSPDDRASVMKSFSVDLGEEENFDDYPTEYKVEEEYYDDAPSAQNQNDAHEVVNIQRVSVMRSPAFNCKVNNNKLDAPAVLDSGATGSMMELDIVEQANIRVYPTSHLAEQADGLSKLNVVGEVHTNITLDNDLTLPISAVVVTSLKEGILIGTPFMKEHKMVIDFGNDSIRIRGREIFFKDMIAKPRKTLLKANVSRVVFPGESMEFEIPANFAKDKEVAIEPRDNLVWPSPQIVENSDGKMEVRNDTELPLKIKSQQVIAQIRSVIPPPENSSLDSVSKISKNNQKTSGLEMVQIDPNNVLSIEQKEAFAVVNNKFQRLSQPKLAVIMENQVQLLVTYC